MRNRIIDKFDGEEMSITGGEKSLLSYVRLAEMNPYSVEINRYNDLPKDFMLYNSGYPINYNNDQLNLAKKSIAFNVRIYKLSIGAYRCQKYKSIY